MSDRSVLERSLWLSDEMFRCVWLRKAYHLIAGSLLLTAIIVLNANWLSAFCVFWILVFGAISKRVSTAVLGVLLLSVLTGSRFTTLGAGMIFVVGDGMAALVGIACGGRKWPWSDQKTIVGSLAFLVGASFAMRGVLSILVQETPSRLFLLSVLPSVIGCLAEAMPLALVRDIRDSKPDDNLLVILSSGAALHWLTKCLQVQGIQ